MSLVLKIRGKKAPAGAPKLYRDPLVDFAGDATLALFDFSNGGAFISPNVVAGVDLMDLSREVSQPLGLDNTAVLKTAEGKENDAVITDGKGFLISSVSQGAGLSRPQGFDAGLDLPMYLADKNPRALVTLWFRLTGGEATGQFATMGNSENTFFRANNRSTFFISFAGGSTGAITRTPDVLIQLSAEYRGAGEPLRRLVNGSFESEGVNEATGFIEPYESLLIGTRNIANPDIVFYRGSFFDLSRTDRTADEIVSYDWDYCHGSGVFAGKPTRRPFIDAI